MTKFNKAILLILLACASMAPAKLKKSDAPAINAYPVPFIASEGHASITFTGVPQGSFIKVCTLNGKVARILEETDSDSTVTWNVKTTDGDELSSGTYIYFVQSPGIIKKGKLVIIR